jgi:hypothetical protein
MPIEEVNLVKDLAANFPFDKDPARQGDSHLRNIKKAITNTFPGANGEGLNKAITLDFTKAEGVNAVMKPTDDGQVYLDHAEYKGELNQQPLGTYLIKAYKELYLDDSNVVRARESLPPIGSVTEMFLTQAQVNEIYGPDTLVLLDGITDITDSRLNAINGMTVLPDMMTEGAFPYNGTEGDYLSYYEDETYLPEGAGVTIKEETHGNAEHGSGSHYHMVWENNNGEVGNLDTGAPHTIPRPKDDAPSTSTYDGTKTISETHKHELTFSGSSETQALSTLVNYFLRIN